MLWAPIINTFCRQRGVVGGVVLHHQDATWPPADLKISRGIYGRVMKPSSTWECVNSVESFYTIKMRLGRQLTWKYGRVMKQSCTWECANCKQRLVLKTEIFKHLHTIVCNSKSITLLWCIVDKSWQNVKIFFPWSLLCFNKIFQET